MSAQGPSLRLGEERDLAGLVAIYNHWVETAHVTFDTIPFEVEARRPWFRQFASAGACRLVVAVDGQEDLLGYATSSPFKAKPAYSISVETSVYLAPHATGRGIGRRLYERLFDELSGEDVHGAFAGIALPNEPSIKLHEDLGFRLVGTFHEVGRKFGRLWDVSWYERRIRG